MGPKVPLGEGWQCNANIVRCGISGLTMPLETAARCGASVHVELRPAQARPAPSTSERGVGVVIDTREASASARWDHNPSVRRRRKTA